MKKIRLGRLILTLLSGTVAGFLMACSFFGFYVFLFAGHNQQKEVEVKIPESKVVEQGSFNPIQVPVKDFLQKDISKVYVSFEEVYLILKGFDRTSGRLFKSVISTEPDTFASLSIKNAEYKEGKFAVYYKRDWKDGFLCTIILVILAVVLFYASVANAKLIKRKS